MNAPHPLARTGKQLASLLYRVCYEEADPGLLSEPEPSPTDTLWRATQPA